MKPYDDLTRKERDTIARAAAAMGFTSPRGLYESMVQFALLYTDDSAIATAAVLRGLSKRPLPRFDNTMPISIGYRPRGAS